MNFKEKQIKSYLDDLLIELEVSKNKIIIEKIVDTFNYYKNEYPNLIKEYQEKGNEILKQLKK